MAMCESGREIPGQGIVTNHLVVEGAWGELWRAEHQRFGRVLFVAYTTTAGMKLFNTSLETLKRWKQSSPAVDGLLGIREISAETAVPYVVVDDPGGETLREASADKLDPVDPLQLARWFRALSETLGNAYNLNLLLINPTPDTIILDPTRKSNPLRIVPVAPDANETAPLLADGRYTAPELPGSAQPKLINADSYAIAWMLVDCILQRDDLPQHVEDLREALPTPKLTQVLTAGLFSQGGSYGDARILEGALKRWIRNDAEQDLKILRRDREKAVKELQKEARKAKKEGREVPADSVTDAASIPISKVARKPPETVEKKKKKSGGTLAKTAGIVLLFAAVAAAVVFGMTKFLYKPPEPKTAFATAAEYFEDVERGDLNGATTLAASGVQPKTKALLEELEKTGNVKGNSGVTTALTPQGRQTARTEIRGRNEEVLMFVTIQLEEESQGTWRVTDVVWRKP